MQQIDDLGFCPSFSCYSSDTQASTAAGRISRQLQQQHAARFHDLDSDEHEFEFSLFAGDIGSDGRTVFPLFNRDLIQKLDEEQAACTTTSLQNLFITERDESGESSSSETEAPAVFCVWRHKLDGGASPLSKCKKSSSTGSGSKRWRIRDFLRRSNSAGKDPVMLLTHNNINKKVEIPKQKVNSGEGVAGKLNPSSPSVHELFYVQQRAKREGVKRRSYLPYRQGLVGFFSNVNNGNGKGKKSLF